MATYAGGLRDRLIHDSLFHLVQNGLGTLGWYTTQAPPNPVTVVSEQLDWSQEILPNTISVAEFSASDSEYELGSDGRVNRLIYYVDIFGGSEALGLQLSGDCRDIIRGKFAQLPFFSTPEVIPVFDYTLATPVQIFSVEVLSVARDRPVQTGHRWMNYMHSLHVVLLDYYDNTNDATGYGFSP